MIFDGRIAETGELQPRNAAQKNRRTSYSGSTLSGDHQSLHRPMGDPVEPVGPSGAAKPAADDNEDIDEDQIRATVTAHSSPLHLGVESLPRLDLYGPVLQ